MSTAAISMLKVMIPRTTVSAAVMVAATLALAAALLALEVARKAEDGPVCRKPLSDHRALGSWLIASVLIAGAVCRAAQLDAVWLVALIPASMLACIVLVNATLRSIWKHRLH